MLDYSYCHNRSTAYFATHRVSQYLSLDGIGIVEGTSHFVTFKLTQKFSRGSV